jgi:sugar diacid utilization regulator
MDAAISLERARVALALADEEVIKAERGPIAAADHSVTLLLNADRRLANDVAAAALSPFDGLREGPRLRLRETLAAWLRHRGRTETVAGELHVHPQTVRYRMAQLRELFGDALEDPERRFELELALRVAPTEA